MSEVFHLLETAMLRASQSVSDPAVEYTDALAFQSRDCRDAARFADDQRHIRRLVRDRGNGMGRHALGGITHAWARAEAEINRAGRQCLLQLAVAAEGGDFHVKTGCFPNSDLTPSSRPENGKDELIALPTRTLVSCCAGQEPLSQ